MGSGVGSTSPSAGRCSNPLPEGRGRAAVTHSYHWFVALLVVFVFMALPLAELAVIDASADAFGLGWTFVALVGFSLLGGWLMRREGTSIWRRANEELSMGRVPARQLLDGALVMAGGALLLTPGFITDAAGLALLFPPTRALLRPVLLGVMARRATRVVGVSGMGFGRSASTPTGEHHGPVHDVSARVQPSSAAQEPSARVIGLEVDPPERPS